MKILLISLFYFPEPVARSHDLAITLSQLGHHVKVITAYPNYPNGHIYPGYRMASARWEEIDGISILRVPHVVDRSLSLIRRVLSYTSFSLSVLINGLRKTEKPDIIWTYQIGLPGVLMSKLRHIPLVHEVQDLWPDWGRSANLGLKSAAYLVLERQEKYIYHNAQSVVTITQGFKDILTQKGTRPEKIEIIPNWVNDATFHPCEPDSKLAHDEGFAGYFNILYVGNVGAAQSLGVILDAASQLQDIPNIRFVIIGDGVERAELERRVEHQSLQNVRFLGSRPQSAAASYMALADVLFIHLKRGSVYEITIPSKTYGYLASGRPTLAAAEGELADLINKFNAGIVCPPEDPMALEKAVRRLHKLPKEELVKMGQAGYQAVISNFSSVALGKRYSDLFERVHNSVREGRN